MYNNDVMSNATPGTDPSPGGSPTGQAMLDAARALFVAEGVEAISVRRVATLAGCTTMALYTHFSGKDGLLAALYDEGFAELARAQRAVPELVDPVAYVLALCLAYRETARRFPHHYALMLGRFSGEHQPSRQSAAAALRTLDTLASAVSAALSDAPDRQARATSTARQLFAFCHGWVSLEAMTFIANDQSSERQFTAAVDALLEHAAAMERRSTAPRREENPRR